MNTQIEEVLKEYERYADFCTRIQNNLAMGSTVVSDLRYLNSVIVLNNHIHGYGKLMMTKFQNKIAGHEIMGKNRNKHAMPFIELSESQKTHKYDVLEIRMVTNQRDLHLIESQYEAFVANSMIADYIAPVDAIVAPTIENNGNFRYPLVSARLKYIVEILKGGSAKTFEEAVYMLKQRTNSLKDNRLISKTAEIANYSQHKPVKVYFS